MAMLGYSREQIRRAESLPLAQGKPLMRHAAYALALVVVTELRARGLRLNRARVTVLVGGGNNGGDGLHAAADLRRRGIDVTAILIRSDVHAGGLARARRAGVRIVGYEEAAVEGGSRALQDAAAPGSEPQWRTCCARADIWVDALAGIGAQGGLRGPARRIVAELNEMRDGHCVIAVDTPSGIDADSGAVPGVVLPADRTVTFGGAKAGLLLPPAALVAGQITLAEIGLSERLGDERAIVSRLGEADCSRWWPRAARTSHKYTRGVVGLMAGSARFPGAGLLASGAAVALGPGMVRYLGPASVAEAVTHQHPQVVSDQGRVQALVVGPGMPVDEAFDGVARVIEACSPEAIVWDAGALAFLPAQREYLATYPSILTPHAGEAAELAKRCGLEVSRAEIESDPAHWARELSEALGATVLLKGPVTVVAGPKPAGASEPELYAQADGSPYLATAGSGDVLAGILGALWAQVIAEADIRPAKLTTTAPVQTPAATEAPTTATVAAAAALLHGKASRIASGQEVPQGMAEPAGEGASAGYVLSAGQPGMVRAPSRVGQPRVPAAPATLGHAFTLERLLAVIPVANAAIAAAKPAQKPAKPAH